MSFIGQPHHSGAHDGSGQPLRPHEARAAGQTPPPRPQIEGPRTSPVLRPARPGQPKKGLLGGIFSLGTFAYLVPDDDPWRRAHWRLSAEEPAAD